MTIIRFRSIVCSFVSVGMVWSTVSATEPPESQKGYYEKRISIVEFPSIAKPSEILAPESSLSSVMQSLRMTGLSYAGMPPSHLDEATRVLRSQGYNAVIGGELDQCGIVLQGGVEEGLGRQEHHDELG